ncbi:MAG: hypothetical protein F4051_10045 [Boseongicola sp. SB0670_bin_30]|nr:hypothetical protein [Boseongicola sp. SB0670_bin_30]
MSDRQASLRDPSRVMRLARLGSMHQSRLSFMRVLTRRMARENWTFARTAFDMDETGTGRAIYRVNCPERTYSMLAFGHDLPDGMRSDRVIAEAWDATFALIDGVPDKTDVERLATNVPLQEAGRYSERELVVSRANRSSRLWKQVVAALAAGTQPDAGQLDAVGYLMRTTAVYGSGKFGAVDYADIRNRPEFAAPFQAEMLLVYLIRAFVLDLVEHMARSRGGKRAVALDRNTARKLGIGNATGLGMAPFIVNHATLFNNWIAAREEAIRRVRSVPTSTETELALFLDRLQRSMVLVHDWRSGHPDQRARVKRLQLDLQLIKARTESGLARETCPWDRLVEWSEANLDEEGQECLASLILEPYGRLVDDLSDGMADPDDGDFRIDGSMSLAETGGLFREHYGWALGIDWRMPEETARAWYISEEKLEPRLGERHQEDIAEFEQPLSPGRDAARAYADLKRWPASESVAAFLLKHPEHRHVIRRAQVCRNAPYAEIHDNTIGASMLPIDMMRAKLSFFGATHFDPKSDRWVRIRMYAGAPYPGDLDPGSCEDWVYPELVA